jgi:small-conductance mechanosensitive channel
MVMTWTASRLRAVALILSLGLWLTMPSSATGQTGPIRLSPSATSSLSATPAASAQATPAAAATSAAAAPQIDSEEIIAFLGTVIAWHRQTAQIGLSGEPEETLFLADDRRMADEVLGLAFTFAHAAAQLGDSVRKESGVPPPTAPPRADHPGAQGNAPRLEKLIAHRDKMQALLEHLQDATSELRNHLAGAGRQARAPIAREVAANLAQADLVQSRIDSLNALIDFEQSTGGTGGSPLGVDAQIDELEHSVVPPTGASAPPPSGAAASPSVLPGSLERLLTLREKEQALGDAIALTANLAQAVGGLRERLIRMLAAIDHEGLAQTAQVGNGDLPAVKKTKAEFEALAERSKLISGALEPLSKQTVLLQLYSGNLARWRASVHQWLNAALRHQVIRAISLALVFGAVFVAAAVWRHLTFRYVEDLQRRQKLLQLRRLAVIAAIALVIVLGFASQLSALATVMGFAAAGIALALQNVILSIAGYFYLSGRFGIRIGDCVSIAGITGDVLDSGFFKLTLMELGGDEHGRLPTGRAVIFPNSVVFQPNSNFFRQLPGTSFVWNELRLTLAPDCDYRQAEKLVTDVVDEVFARYRDTVQREYRALESKLNLRVETPRPQSRLQFGQAGLELILRYPTRLSGAVQTADEITRRLVDEIKREPGLRLAVPGVPAIQTESPPSPSPPDPPRKT